MFYAVVEFKSATSNKELSVVPLAWLIKNEKRCYWPTKTNGPLAEFIKSCPLPKKSWPRYAIFKVHLKTATYELAEQELDRLILEFEEAADFSSQSVTKKSIISDSSSSDSDDDVHLIKHKRYENQEICTIPPGLEMSLNVPNQDSSLPKKLNIPDNKINRNIGHSVYTLLSPPASSTSTMTILDEAVMNDIIIASNNIAVNHSDVDQPSQKNSNTDGGGSDLLDFQRTVLSSLGSIQATNDQILMTMQEILRYNKKIALEKLIAPENLPAFPLGLYEEFLNFEKLVQEDPIVNQYMVRRLAALGGSGIQGVTRRIMKFLLTNYLANQFNWKGRFNKVGFEGTGTMKIIYEAAKLNFPSNEKNDMDIAWSVKEWLKHSSTRIKKGSGN